MSVTILLCDDEFPITRAASLKLARAGYAVETRQDGLAAWEAYQQQRPSLLVTDLQMPRLDGIGLIRRIRENDATLPIILLTAKGYEIDETALRAEFDPFRLFSKPFSPRELADAVGQMLTTAPVALS